MTRINRSSIRRVAAIGTLTLVSALGACQDDAPSPVAPASDPVAAKTGAGKGSTIETVLLTGTRNGNADIYAMNPDGSNIRRITTDTLADRSPSFAPGNRRIVWVRVSDKGSQLFTANPDGSKETPLTPLQPEVAVNNPRYSPDGTKIAFEMTARDSAGPVKGAINTDIYVINADGSGLTRLTYETSEDRQPAWSPDGQTIAFASDRYVSGYMSIYAMTAGGLNVRNLIGCDQNCLEPEYSPDGTKVAFASAADGMIEVLTVVGAPSVVGVGPRPDAGASRHPTWSKDGSRVLFASDRGFERTMELYAGTPGSSDPASVRRLTVFSPDVAESPSHSR